ncbi:MAG: hypothetical protein ACI83O_000303 [Patescibacteria group bacterium]|jgi:hypothetical protein
MDITTIKINKGTKERLDKLRENRSESYDDLLKKILYVLNTTRDDPIKAKRFLERISEMRERMLDSEEAAELERAEDEKKKAERAKAKRVK